jgi:hypothetical protein
MSAQERSGCCNHVSRPINVSRYLTPASPPPQATWAGTLTLVVATHCPLLPALAVAGGDCQRPLGKRQRGYRARMWPWSPVWGGGWRTACLRVAAGTAAARRGGPRGAGRGRG